MRPIFGMVLAGSIGVMVGAGGMSVLQAQTAEPAAFIVSNTQEVKDPDLLKKYQAAAPATQVPFGGHPLVRAAMPQMLPGQSGAWAQAGLPKGTIVIIEFPSMKNLLAWWNSPAYSGIRKQREQATAGQMFAVEAPKPQ